jgi:hypothetical protein
MHCYTSFRRLSCNTWITVIFWNIFITAYYINVRENRRGNKEWAIQRSGQHWAHKMQEEDIQNIKTQQQHNTTN